MYTIGHGIWRENRKTWIMRHKHYLTWNVARDTENGDK